MYLSDDQSFATQHVDLLSELNFPCREVWYLYLYSEFTAGRSPEFTVMEVPFALWITNTPSLVTVRNPEESVKGLFSARHPNNLNLIIHGLRILDSQIAVTKVSWTLETQLEVLAWRFQEFPIPHHLTSSHYCIFCMGEFDIKEK